MPGARADSKVSTISFADAVTDDCQCGAPCHTHNRAGADLHARQYSGQVGPVYIEPKYEPGGHDREVFLILKEFDPSFSQGGDMAQDFLTPATRVKELETAGESAMKASLAKGMPHGY